MITKNELNALTTIKNDLNEIIVYNANDIADARAEIKCAIQMMRAKIHDLSAARRENIEKTINEIAEMNDKIDDAVVEIWHLSIILESY